MKIEINFFKEDKNLNIISRELYKSAKEYIEAKQKCPSSIDFMANIDIEKNNLKLAEKNLQRYIFIYESKYIKK